jgi:hypothetical protein
MNAFMYQVESSLIASRIIALQPHLVVDILAPFSTPCKKYA